SDADLEILLNGITQEVDFLIVVDDRDTVPVPPIDQGGNVLDVLVSFEPVADHKGVLTDLAILLQVIDNIDVKGRGGLDVNVVFQGLVQNMLEMGAFGTVTVVVGTFVIVFFHSPGKQLLRPNDV